MVPHGCVLLEWRSRGFVMCRDRLLMCCRFRGEFLMWFGGFGHAEGGREDVGGRWRRRFKEVVTLPALEG
ncbi:hypothetical protein KC19_5G186900 [Ceratodon purpureus]|uniref:Uncharacterized protein n=1 Tax=Ceratodon purpureus TaxID=3225 RepID=A0A8T0I582_CERPU|nr:hypothetical protein KC19_5G186900 [Ceratodon purpureus]